MADVVSIGIALDTSQVLAGTRQVTQALHQVETAEKAVQQQTSAVERATQQAAQAFQTESQAARGTAQALQNAGQQTSSLTQHDKALIDAATRSAEALNRQRIAGQQAGESTQTLGRHARTTQGAMERLGQSLIAFGGAAFALNTIKSAFEGMVSAALKIEGLNAAFKAITGSAQGAGEAMQFVRATGERLGVQADAIAGSYKGLLAATQGTSLSLKDTQTLFLGVVEASRALALSSEDTAGALRPLVQIISQGAVQADELRNEFASRVPGSMQLLVTASNGAFKSIGELNKAMEDGKLKGQAALDLMANFGIVLRQRFAPAAEEAARGTAAAFARMQQAVTDLQVALGTALLPTLADVARALTGLMTTAQGTTSAFAQGFTLAIREAASMAIGLSGAVVVLGKYMAALGAGMAFGAEAWKAGWEDVKQTAADVTTAQQQMLNPPTLTRLNPKLPPLPGDYGALRTLNLDGGDGKKARGKSDAEKAATQLASEQLSLRKQLNDAYDKALYSERELTDLHLQRAKFSEQERGALMRHYDDTKLLEEDNKLKEDRLALDKQLQEALDKQQYTERELLQRKMEGLRYGEEEIKIRLKLFDKEKQIREEKERQVEAEKDAVRASEEHVRTVERLMDKLEPQRRRMSRAEQLQGTMSELAGETSDPFTLAQADIKREDTLRQERLDDIQQALERLGDAAARTFVDMAVTGDINFTKMGETFSQMVLEMVADAIDLKGALSGLLKDLMGQPASGGQAGSGAMGLLGGLFGSGGGGASTAALQTDITTSMASNPELFALGGMAAGGPVAGGTPYMVGERGPELFVPRTSGTIVPHGGSAGGPQVTVHMVVNTPNADSFRQSQPQIAAQMTRAAQQARRVM